MSTVLWSRTAAAVRERFGRTALAQYGAGLHTDCDDCAVEPSDVEIPSQRREQAVQRAPMADEAESVSR